MLRRTHPFCPLSQHLTGPKSSVLSTRVVTRAGLCRKILSRLLPDAHLLTRWLEGGVGLDEHGLMSPVHVWCHIVVREWWSEVKCNVVYCCPSVVLQKLLDELEELEIPTHIREARLAALKHEATILKDLQEKHHGVYTSVKPLHRLLLWLLGPSL